MGSAQILLEHASQGLAIQTRRVLCLDLPKSSANHHFIGSFTSFSPCCLDSDGINLLHRHHRFEGTLCLIATSCKRIHQRARCDLPGDALAVLASTAFAFRADIADYGIPVTIRLFLIVSRNLEGKGLRVLEGWTTSPIGLRITLDAGRLDSVDFDAKGGVIRLHLAATIATSTQARLRLKQASTIAGALSWIVASRRATDAGADVIPLHAGETIVTLRKRAM